MTLDIGDAGDIHPRNKQEVGRRLALVALAGTYGQAIACAGPVFRGLEVRGNLAIVGFDHAEGLAAAEGKVSGFAIAGEDKVFHWAEGRIEGSTVVLQSQGVPIPLAVRYNWAGNPIGDLRNAAGLPASSFRTDDWPRSEIKAAAPATP